VAVAAAQKVAPHPFRHGKLKTWADPAWQEIIQPTYADRKTRLAYN